MTTQTDTIDLEAIKSRQHATWASGDYAVIGTTLQIVGESLCEAVDITAGSRVLDVAAGNGNASLAAARRGAEVTATDYVEDLLHGAKRRADADGLLIETRVADAENLPYEDGSFDYVLSTFGVMFTPNPERSSAEMARVCRPGGTHRPRELDARGLHRPDVQDHRRSMSRRPPACRRRSRGARKTGSTSCSTGRQRSRCSAATSRSATAPRPTSSRRSRPSTARW